MDLPAIVKEKLISLGAGPEDAYLVAVSGGADSTALLLAMKAAIGSEGDLIVAHLDHSVRQGSRRDLKKVVELCGKLGLVVVTGQLNPSELESYRRLYGSLEAGMRVLRYRFLLKTAEKKGVKWIVTGHTADDQAETVLFRITRRMDWRSLGGIPGRRSLILRPLIDVSRTATRSYCEVMGISPIMDPSNYDETYARNRIRNRILPGLISGFNPDVSDLLRRMGGQAARLSIAEEHLLNKITPGLYDEGTGLIQRDDLMALPGILQERVIVELLVQKLGEYPSRNLVKDIIEFILAGQNGQLSLPGEMILIISYGMVHICKKIGMSGYNLPAGGLELKIPGQLKIPSAGITITAKESTLVSPENYPFGNTALLSKKRVKGSLWIRKRLPGDRFTPIGMERDKKLKDFLIDRKIPKANRDLIPIVLDAKGDIVWVGGIEISQKVSLDGVEGEEAILLRIKENIE